MISANTLEILKKFPNPVTEITNGWSNQFSQISKQTEKWVALPRSLKDVMSDTRVATNIASRIILSLAATVFLSVGALTGLTTNLMLLPVLPMMLTESAGRAIQIAGRILFLPFLVPASLSFVASLSFTVSGMYIFNRLNAPTQHPSAPTRDPYIPEGTFGIDYVSRAI